MASSVSSRKIPNNERVVPNCCPLAFVMDRTMPAGTRGSWFEQRESFGVLAVSHSFSAFSSYFDQTPPPTERSFRVFFFLHPHVLSQR